VKNVSHSLYETVKRENTQLKREISMYKLSWMRKCLPVVLKYLNSFFKARPTGSAATYLVEAGRLLSGALDDNNDEQEKGDKLENICLALKMNETELKSCEHETDITKSCRQIIKYIYPDIKDRAKKLVSSMDDTQLQAIQGKISKYYLSPTIITFLDYARMAHPAQMKTPNSVLNNAIGNVFASDKRKLERMEMEKYTSNETNDGLEEEDDT
jgi:hypothetical protein